MFFMFTFVCFICEKKGENMNFYFFVISSHDKYNVFLKYETLIIYINIFTFHLLNTILSYYHIIFFFNSS